MSFYYTREPGPEGQILTDDGDAAGVVLSTLLERGPLPVHAALELIANAADIITIAEEDQASHGDLKPGFVRVAGDGAVSIEGYGVSRRGGRAPEGMSMGTATDIYGLGTVMHALLSSESMGAIPRDRDGHDDAIVDKLLQIDWGDLQDRRWMDEVVHFLCSMLAFEPDERPAPLDVANVLSQVAGQTPGEDLVTWAARLVGGGGRPAAPFVEEEDLGGPQALSTPLTHGGSFKVRQAASAKGEATAFWSHEKINALLSEDDQEYLRARAEDKARKERFSPGASGGVVPQESAIPAFPDATVSGQAAAVPRHSAPPNLAGPRPAPPSPRPVAPPPRPVAPPAPAPVAPPPRPVAPPAPAPAAPPPRPAPATPFAVAGTLPPQPAPAAPSGGGRAKLAFVVVLVLALFCGLGGIGLGGWYILGHSSDTAVAVPPVPDAPPAPAEPDTPAAQDEEEAAPVAPVEPEAAPAPAPAPKKPAPSTRRKRSTHRKTSSSPSVGTPVQAPAPEPVVEEPAPAPSGSFPAAVSVTVQGREAKLQCGNGVNLEFVGTTRQTFDDVTTCVVVIDGIRAAFQVHQSGTWTCEESGGHASCRGG